MSHVGKFMYYSDGERGFFWRDRILLVDAVPDGDILRLPSERTHLKMYNTTAINQGLCTDPRSVWFDPLVKGEVTYNTRTGRFLVAVDREVRLIEVLRLVEVALCLAEGSYDL